MQWLEPYLKLRTTQSNVELQDYTDEIQIDEESREHMEADSDSDTMSPPVKKRMPSNSVTDEYKKKKLERLLQSCDREHMEADSDSDTISLRSPPVKKRMPSNSVTNEYKKKKNEISLQEAEIKAMENINIALSEFSSTTRTNDHQDSDNVLFGLMVASELKSLQPSNKFQLKHEINTLIFKYHEMELSQFSADPTVTVPSSTPNNPFSFIANKSTTVSRGPWYDAIKSYNETF